jgi:hypothetical protein
LNDLIIEETKGAGEIDVGNPLVHIDTAGALMYEAVEVD